MTKYKMYSYSNPNIPHILEVDMHPREIRKYLELYDVIVQDTNVFLLDKKEIETILNDGHESKTHHAQTLGCLMESIGVMYCNKRTIDSHIKHMTKHNIINDNAQYAIEYSLKLRELSIQARKLTLQSVSNKDLL